MSFQSLFLNETVNKYWNDTNVFYISVHTGHSDKFIFSRQSIGHVEYSVVKNSGYWHVLVSAG